MSAYELLTMTLEGDCNQEELSDGQKKYYSNTAKAHELSMLEVEKLKKGNI